MANKVMANKGFSLVELSIVLVILGLLVGGILGGQSLIRAAELRSVTEDLNKHYIAFNSFKDRYFALPGDMPNATAFWGAAHAVPATCRDTIGTGTQTCDGSGDRHIDQSAVVNERYRAWQHLANAGLIKGTYTGVSVGGDETNGSPGINTPKSSLGGLGYQVWMSGGWTDAAQYFPNTAERRGMQLYTIGAASLSPEELWNIDTKVDDGKPATGTMFTFISTSTWAWGPCSSTDDPATAEYNLSNTDKICDFYYILEK